LSIPKNVIVLPFHPPGLYIGGKPVMHRLFYFFFSLTAAFFLYSCNATPDTAETAFVDEKQDTLIDFIKMRSQPREQFSNLIKVRWKRHPQVEQQVIEQLIARSVNDVNNDTIFPDTGMRYIVFDHQDLENLFLFSIACWKPDSNYTRLYHFTLDKKEHLLFGCTLIGKSYRLGKSEYSSRLSYAKDGLSLIVNSRADRHLPHKELLIDKWSERFDFREMKTDYRLLHEAHKRASEYP